MTGEIRTLTRRLDTITKTLERLDTTYRKTGSPLILKHIHALEEMQLKVMTALIDLRRSTGQSGRILLRNKSGHQY